MNEDYYGGNVSFKAMTQCEDHSLLPLALFLPLCPFQQVRVLSQTPLQPGGWDVWCSLLSQWMRWQAIIGSPHWDARLSPELSLLVATATSGGGGDVPCRVGCSGSAGGRGWGAHECDPANTVEPGTAVDTVLRLWYYFSLRGLNTLYSSWI